MADLLHVAAALELDADYFIASINSNESWRERWAQAQSSI